jgi:sporulation protein YlmC with PRC-barrel domain
MKKILFRLSAIAIAATLAGGIARAQQDPSAPSGTISGSSSASSQSAIGTSTSAGAKISANYVMASRAIGASIKSNTGENLGQIEDLLVDQSGQIKMAVLGVGGFLGIGAKKTPVPWQAVTASSDKDFTLNIDRQKLKNAPAIDKNQAATDWATPNFMTEVYAHYGMQDNSAAGGTGSGSLGTQSGSQFKNDARDLKDDIKEKGRELKDDVKRGTEKTKDRLTNP